MIRQPDAGSASAAFILLLMICLGPLYFGSVLPTERAALQVGAFLALALVLAGRKQIEALAPIAGPALAIAAVGFYGVLQSLPVPESWVAILAPRLADVWSGAGAVTGTETATMALSLAPSVSRQTGLHWLAVAAAMAAAAVVGGDRRSRRLLAAGLLAVAIFQIVYGADNWFGLRDTIWGLEVGGNSSRVRGTFVNPDHLALFLAIPTTGGFAFLWWSVRRLVRRGEIERRLLLAFLPSLIFLMLFVGLAFTGSRAGLASIIVAILAQALMLAFHYRRWQAGLTGLAALALGLGGIGLFGLQKGLGRWMETSAFEVTWNSRLAVYIASWDLWQLAPWTGTGLGTFRQAFPMVQPANLSLTWTHAHSDVLELLVTAGLVGLPLVGFGLVALCRQLWRVFQKGRRSEDRGAGLAALGALVGVLLHSCVDFGLTIPANAFSLAIVCGMACGAKTGKSGSAGAVQPRTARSQDDKSPGTTNRTRPG